MKTPLAAILFAALVSWPFASALHADPLPPGWFPAGSHPQEYEMGTMPTEGATGEACGYIFFTGTTPSGFGTLMQTFGADEYRGKRVRMSARVKTEGVTPWAGLWMRVDGEGEENYNLSFDNMQDRPIQGTTGFTKHDIVLDLPEKSTAISFGVLLGGKGKAWVDDFSFEVVGDEVPVTGQQAFKLPTRPQGLDFEKVTP